MMVSSAGAMTRSLAVHAGGGVGDGRVEVEGDSERVGDEFIKVGDGDSGDDVVREGERDGLTRNVVDAAAA
jgi:hypothetical protein